MCVEENKDLKFVTLEQTIKYGGLLRCGEGSGQS